MKEQKSQQQEGRRGFLKMASVGGAAATAAALIGADQAQAAEPDGGHGAKGYRETAHVKKVYDLARF